MDNSEDINDQSSGWFQVKKRQRSSSKVSLQSWVGGFRGKSTSNLSRRQQVTYRSQLTKAAENRNMHCQKNIAHFENASKEGKTVDQNKCLFNHNADSIEPSPPLIKTSVAVGEVHQNDKYGVLPKIRWGDLEEGDLVQHCLTAGTPMITFGNIREDNLACGRKYVGNAQEAKPDTSEVNSQELGHKMHVEKTWVGVDKIADDKDMLNCDDLDTENIVAGNDGCLNANKDLYEISLQEREIKGVSVQSICIEGSISFSQGESSEQVNLIEKDLLNDMNVVTASLAAVIPSINEQHINCLDIDSEHGNQLNVGDGLPLGKDSGFVDPPPTAVTHVRDGCTSSKLQAPNSDVTPMVNAQEKSLSPVTGPENLGPSSSSEASIKDTQFVQIVDVDDVASNSCNMRASIEESSERKERFRERLWCFLFENLNRAVDELYLLCELECDLEQMKEAILVLEEAASDFKELNSRVETFDRVKRFSAQSNDGVPVVLKSDHRRSHALSWEVRRMTTTPHKADILSSSLEAFRRIQRERASVSSTTDAEGIRYQCPSVSTQITNVKHIVKESVMKAGKQTGNSYTNKLNPSETIFSEVGTSCKEILVQNECSLPDNLSSLKTNLPSREASAASIPCKSKEQIGAESVNLVPKRDKFPVEGFIEKKPRAVGTIRRQTLSEKDKEKKNVAAWKSMDAWKDKRNWRDILSSPYRVSSRSSYSPGLSRKSLERTRILHDKLMSPEKKKKTILDLKKEAEEKHARAMRIRSELENERVQKLQRTSEKLNRVNEWQAVRSMKLREGMYARQQRGESRHEAFLAQVVKRAGDESSKVNEVRFITSLNEENKKIILRQKLHGSELRRAEKLQVLKIKQKEDLAREEAVLERRKLIEAEKLQRLAEIQRKKEEAKARREEERKASSAAREARAIEQLRRKEERAKAQQEEAELLAQKLAERLSESEQRRKVYLEQIRERASMDFRDQSSPLFRRSTNKEGQSRSTPNNSGDDYPANIISRVGGSTLTVSSTTLQHSMKRRIKKIRQRLMALKFEFPEPTVSENAGIGYRTAVATARGRIGRWLQELQRLRQARKEGAASIGLITAEMIKYLEGKEPELQASRQSGLLDFIASALPASHTSKPEACLVTLHLLKLLRTLLSATANRSYFLAENLLPPLIPMLSAALENYIKFTASLNVASNTNMSSTKASAENFESVSEIVNNFLWIVTIIIGHVNSDERQLQMRDGLLELLLSYQIVHRLRDLFALHDRPQMEGSAFPISILSSVHLLVVLTSRPGNVCFIDWESSPVEAETKMVSEGEIFSSHFGNSYFTEDYRSSLSLLNLSPTVHLPKVPEDAPLNSCILDKNEGTVSTVKDGEMKQTVKQMKSNSVSPDKKDVLDESRKNQSDNNVTGKNEKTVDNGSEEKSEKVSGRDQSSSFVLSVVSETGLISLPSLLTAVLLQANNRTSSEQASFILPSNFEEVATGVLKVLNNLAVMDLCFLQKMLARPDLKMEFFHIMSFILTHCDSKWNAPDDQVALLLLESLLLLGHFALFHPGNQAVLRWGKSPTILHKICDLPFVFFSDPDLMPILAGTLVAASYGCSQNKGVIQQELSVDMLLSLLKSCRNVLVSQLNATADNSQTEDSSETNWYSLEFRKPQVEIPTRHGRFNVKSSRISVGKGGASGNSIKSGKLRIQRDSKAMKSLEEVGQKHNLPTSVTLSRMLHRRFPYKFIDRAELFLSAEIPHEL